jgi:hypothetical protein
MGYPVNQRKPVNGPLTLRTNYPNCRYVTAYHKLKDELFFTNNGKLLRDNRIGIPKSLQSRTLAIAHEEHQGIAKTLRLR